MDFNSNQHYGTYYFGTLTDYFVRYIAPRYTTSQAYGPLESYVLPEKAIVLQEGAPVTHSAERVACWRSPMETIDSLVGDKVVFLGERVHQLESDLMKRQALMEANVRKIDYEICRTDGHIANLIHHFPDSVMSKTTAQKKSSLYNALAALERERREQTISCWADTARMKKEFFEVAELYEAAKKRNDIVGGVNGDQH